jgi:hypothetical protein
MESCFADSQTYVGCDLTGSGLNVGAGTGQVSVSGQTATAYVVLAKSKSSNTFTITKKDDGTTDRTCSGCSGGTW